MTVGFIDSATTTTTTTTTTSTRFVDIVVLFVRSGLIHRKKTVCMAEWMRGWDADSICQRYKMEAQDQGHQPYAFQAGQTGQTGQRTVQQESQHETQPGTNMNTPGTPPRPPYSPVTPVFAQLAPVQPNNGTGHSIVPPPVSQAESPTEARTAQFASQPQHGPSQMTTSSSSSTTTTPAQFATEPPPAVPISESENPDAIALRSAISILQMQKQQSLRDMYALDRMKKAAKADPERFARELAGGKLSGADRGFLTLDHGEDDEEDSDGEGEGNGSARMDQDDPFASLGKIPPPQNVVRMPPVNWAKYQIVGEPLDKMHAEQIRRPSTGEPLRAPEHILASPYRPLVDRLEGGGK